MAARPAHTGYASPPLPTVASIPLSSSQAVRIHGWFAPSRRLSWQEVHTHTMPSTPRARTLWTVHGWLTDCGRLLQVRQRPDLTFCTLYATLSGRLAHEAGGGGAQRHSCPESSRALDSLYLMQPSILQWIAARKVALVDYEVMHRRWAVNPITDFGSR